MASDPPWLALAEQTPIHREWSPTQLPGYVIDYVYGGYCESDAMFRARLKAKIEKVEDDGTP